MKNYALILLLTASTAGSQTFAQDSLKKKEMSATSKVIQNTVVIDTANRNESVQAIARKVVESTYKNFPQQQGQPTIIINNIIMPSEPGKVQVGTAQPVAPSAPAPVSPVYDPEYQEWLRTRHLRKAMEATADQREASPASLTPEKEDNFKNRFAELPPRKSGVWVMPMVGIHASGFKANFDEDKYQGRSGWNAGLDVRMRANRFFVQPGVHYFNTSTEVTEKDSIENSPVLSGPRIHSLKVPLMFGVYLTSANRGFFKLNVKGGVVANYLLAVDANSRNNLERDNINDFYYGVNAGVGLEFGLIALDVTHEWGVTDYFRNSNQKNNILRVTLGIKI